MDTNKVIKIRNLNDTEKNFDMDTILTMLSDSIYIYSGTYASEEGRSVLVDRDSIDAEYRAYSNIESCDLVKVPIEFCDLFEKNSRVVFLNNQSSDFSSRKNDITNDDSKRLVRRISSNR